MKVLFNEEASVHGQLIVFFCSLKVYENCVYSVFVRYKRPILHMLRDNR